MDNDIKEVKEEKMQEKKKGFFSRMSRPKKIIFVIVVVLLVLAAAAGITFLVISNQGKNSIYNGYKTNDKMMSSKTVQYNGQTYEYRDNLINILLMGIDTERTIPYIREHVEDDEKINSKNDGGQADSIFLLTIDPDNKRIDVIPINRHSWTEIKMYDALEEYYYNEDAQISLQHAYGTGLEDSCELEVKALSNMLHNIPINGYVSINLPAIRTLNDLVGGVEVEVLDNIPPKAHGNYDYGIGDSLTNVIGQKITLNGNQAYAYVRYRDTSVAGSNEDRMERQKQYITGLTKKLMSSAKKDITFPLKIMEALSDYMVTDIDTPELIYLGTTALGYSYDLKNMEGLPGEIFHETSIYMGYKLDQEALQALIIKKFYKPAG